MSKEPQRSQAAPSRSKRNAEDQKCLSLKSTRQARKQKKREDNAKRCDVFKRALAKKEKWAISRAK